MGIERMPALFHCMPHATPYFSVPKRSRKKPNDFYTPRASSGQSGSWLCTAVLAADNYVVWSQPARASREAGNSIPANSVEDRTSFARIVGFMAVDIELPAGCELLPARGRFAAAPPAGRPFARARGRGDRGLDDRRSAPRAGRAALRFRADRSPFAGWRSPGSVAHRGFLGKHRGGGHDGFRRHQGSRRSHAPRRERLPLEAVRAG